MSHPMDIAILNGTTEILDLLSEYLRSEGYTVITGLTPHFKAGKEDFVQFIRKYNPAVIIYDVPPPYVENMTFLRLLTDTHSMDERCVIVTTTNKAVLERLTGARAAVEVVGKPYDLEVLLKVVRHKLKECPRP